LGSPPPLVAAAALDPQPAGAHAEVPERTAPERETAAVDEALRRLTLLEEPLVPLAGERDDAENAALLEVLEEWRDDPTNLRALVDFATAHPASRWRPAVLVNVGLLEYRGGYFLAALEHWRGAWEQARAATGLRPRWPTGR
jgi:hypothetical protein